MNTPAADTAVISETTTHERTYADRRIAGLPVGERAIVGDTPLRTSTDVRVATEPTSLRRDGRDVRPLILAIRG
jgi:hypothetical protein